jgi:hypothetical protein
MTDQPLQKSFVDAYEKTFAVQRSAWLNSFAALELAIWECLARLSDCEHPSGLTVGQRLEKLKNLKPSPRLRTAAAVDAKRLAQECEPLLTVRASLVHGVMEHGYKAGTPVAFFYNVRDVIQRNHCCLVMTTDDLETTQASVERLTRTLSGLSR